MCVCGAAITAGDRPHSRVLVHQSRHCEVGKSWQVEPGIGDKVISPLIA